MVQNVFFMVLVRHMQCFFVVLCVVVYFNGFFLVFIGVWQDVKISIHHITSEIST